MFLHSTVDSNMVISATSDKYIRIKKEEVGRPETHGPHTSQLGLLELSVPKVYKHAQHGFFSFDKKLYSETYK